MRRPEPVPRSGAGGKDRAGPRQWWAASSSHPTIWVFAIAAKGLRLQAPCRSGGGADRGLVDLAVDVALELLEVLLEALGDVARGAVVGLLVRPRVLGV